MRGKETPDLERGSGKCHAAPQSGSGSEVLSLLGCKLLCGVAAFVGAAVLLLSPPTAAAATNTLLDQLRASPMAGATM